MKGRRIPKTSFQFMYGKKKLKNIIPHVPLLMTTVSSQKQIPLSMTGQQVLKLGQG